MPHDHLRLAEPRCSVEDTLQYDSGRATRDQWSPWSSPGRKILAILALLTLLVQGSHAQPVGDASFEWVASAQSPVGMSQDIRACRQDVDAFISGLGRLMLSMDPVPQHLADLGWEASQQAVRINDEQYLALCQVLASQDMQASHLEALATELDLNNRAQGCVGIPTYLSIGALRMVLDIAGEVVQAVCDSSSCPAPLEPPTCGWTCALPPIFGVASEIISIRMDVADKCANVVHETQMAGMRSDASVTISDASRSAIKADLDLMIAAENSADEEDLQQTDDALQVAFVSDSGIGPSLDQLSTVVVQASELQREFEREALFARLETALASGAFYSRMLRPRVFDGVLEDVRELVARRIQAFSAAGLDITDALAAFGQADDAFNQNDYQTALQTYRIAYLALVAVEGLNQQGGGK